MKFENIKQGLGERDLTREDMIRRLHDQKTGDFDPDTGVIYDWHSAGYDKAINYQAATESIENIGNANEAEQRIAYLINNLDNIQLLPDSIHDIEQQKLLQEKVKTMKSLIEDSLEYAVDYVASIREMSKVKLNDGENSREDYIDDLKTSDAARRLKHNALIDSLKIANRFLQNNFGEITDETLTKFKDAERRSGRVVLEVCRRGYGKNGIVADDINLNNRDQVRDWAILITDSLDQIKKELR